MTKKKTANDDTEGHQNRPPAPSFATAEEMSAHQFQREIDQALRVQAMSPEERTEWLRATWDPLQREATLIYRDLIPPSEQTARHFATMEEKNRFDEQREIEWALRLALARQSQKPPSDESAPSASDT